MQTVINVKCFTTGVSADTIFLDCCQKLFEKQLNASLVKFVKVSFHLIMLKLFQNPWKEESFGAFWPKIEMKI